MIQTVGFCFGRISGAKRRKPGYPGFRFAPFPSGTSPSYPLREPKPRSGFGFAEFHAVKLLGPSGWSLGLCPKLRKPKRAAFWFPLRGSVFGAFFLEKIHIFKVDGLPAGGARFRHDRIS
jgi:hypothetical protein